MTRWLWLGILAACGGDEDDVGTDAGETSPTLPPAPTTPPPQPTTPAPTTPTGTGPTADTGTAAPAEAPDYRARGPYPVRTSTDTVSASCTMTYDRYLPDGVSPGALVVLAHGFQRTRADVAGHAEHLASWGVAVAAPSLCASTIFTVDHAQNGADLVVLGQALAGGLPVIYAGHSAGGLASMLAAIDDPGATAQLGLDLVDSQGLALGRADELGVPGFGILGDPDICNEQRNGEPVYAAAPQGRAVWLVGTDHCDYESPTDIGCTLLCGGGSAADAVVRPTIQALMTSFVIWQAGLDERAAQWWTPGEAWYDLIAGSGSLVEL